MAAPKKKKAGQKTARAPKAAANPARTLVTQSEYARHRKVTPECVRQWREKGRLVTEGKDRALRVDVEASDKRLAMTRDPQQDMAMRRRMVRDDDESEDDELGEDSEGESFEYWRTRKEAANAKLAEAKLEEEAGRLVDRKLVTDAVFELANDFKSSLLNLPARIAGSIAGRLGCNERELQTALDVAIREHLEAEKKRVLRLKK